MYKLISIIILVAGVSDGSRIGFRKDEKLVFGHLSQGQLSRVTSGENAKEGEFPYQIALHEFHRQVCGGVIISEKAILTAAHCIIDGKDNPNRFEVLAGHTSLKNPGPNVQASKIEKVISHPSYPGKLGPNDIAVLLLTTPFKWSPYVQKAELPPAGKDVEGDAWLTGWGSVSTTPYPVFPDILQKAKVPIISYKACNDFFNNGRLDEKSNLCTGPLNGNVSGCSGDSGGPLVKEVDGKKMVVGLVSWGRVPCGQGSPTVFTKVSNFIDFIKSSLP